MLKKLVIVLALLGLAPLFAQGPGNEAGSERRAESSGAVSQARSVNDLTAQDVEAWMNGFLPYALQRGQIPGAVVVIVKDGEPLFEKGYGYADIAAGQPVDPATTLFRPGSVSKLFTWTAVMQQVEAGRLDLDADVNEYLDFTIPPRDGEPITLRQIMTHTAGFEESIRHLISYDPDAVMALDKYVGQALPKRVAAPGTTPAYSNYATALAGHIVARVSGMAYDEYIETRIFDPLGMDHSTFRQPLPAQFEAMMSNGYKAGNRAMPFEIVVPAPAGSLSASGSDIGKFMIAHLDQGGPLLRPSTTKMMHDYRAPGVGPLNTMALGFYEQRINGKRMLSHGGDTELFHSNLWLIPDENIGVYISMNAAGNEGASQAIRSALMQGFANRYFPETRRFEPIDRKTAIAHARMMEGSYVMSRGAFTNFMSILTLLGPMDVTATENGQISVQALDGLSAGPRNWVEVEPFVWRDTNTGERLAAEVKDGEVVRFSIDTFSPFTVLTPAPFAKDPTWLVPALIFAFGAMLIAAIGWPVRALVRRNYSEPFILSGHALLAYRMTRLFCWALLFVAVGWGVIVASFLEDIGSIGGPLDWLIHLLRVVTPIAAFGLMASAIWHLVLCFKDGRSWTMKVGAAILVAAGVIVSWVTIAFNLFGFNMVY